LCRSCNRFVYVRFLPFDGSNVFYGSSIQIILNNSMFSCKCPGLPYVQFIIMVRISNIISVVRRRIINKKDATIISIIICYFYLSKRHITTVCGSDLIMDHVTNLIVHIISIIAAIRVLKAVVGLCGRKCGSVNKLYLC